MDKKYDFKRVEKELEQMWQEKEIGPMSRFSTN